jgi:PIN domain nuclease of toxin-antitoxin system
VKLCVDRAARYAAPAASVATEAFHRDPADRLIVATARAHNALLVTKDERLLAHEGVQTVW